MNDALKEFLANGGEIQQLPSNVPRDLNVCLNCKNLFPTSRRAGRFVLQSDQSAGKTAT